MDLIGTLWEVAEKVDSVMLSPLRFTHSSTSLTVPERSRREGRLFACHSDPDAVNRGKNPFHSALGVNSAKHPSSSTRGKLGEGSLPSTVPDSSSSRCNESGLLRMTASASRVTP